MSYVEQTLAAGERIVYRASLHWFTYLGPALLVLMGIVAREALGTWVLVAGIVAVLIAYLRVRTSEFAVTDRRVILKIGIIRRRSVELLLGKVESVGVDQGITGRIFNFGTVAVSGSGGTREQFQMIAAPLEFRRQVQAQTEARTPGQVA